MIKMETPTESYIIHYPQAAKYADQQAKHFWTKYDIDLTKDILDVKTKLSPAEAHALKFVQLLFTKYEVTIGTEYWGNKVMRWFPRPEIQRMASVFAATEMQSHAEFYNELNVILGIANEEFYTSYKEYEVLQSRMLELGDIVESKNKALSLGVFSLMEGAVLYSSFAFLKHFSMNGKNVLSGVSSGINYSVRDENLHAEAGAWLFRQYLQESKLSESELDELQLLIEAAAYDIQRHEYAIIDILFSKGNIEGITKEDMKVFVDSRIGLCLANLGYPYAYDNGADHNLIAGWFYKGITQTKIHDFFAKAGSEYTRDWVESRFIWKVDK
jgi:ribonucleotide reductase beta subunit family protein with ferritin-like domain